MSARKWLSVLCLLVAASLVRAGSGIGWSVAASNWVTILPAAGTTRAAAFAPEAEYTSGQTFQVGSQVYGVVLPGTAGAAATGFGGLTATNGTLTARLVRTSRESFGLVNLTDGVLYVRLSGRPAQDGLPVQAGGSLVWRQQRAGAAPAVQIWLSRAGSVAVMED